MSYIKDITLSAVGDGPHIDAFGRLRSSLPYTVADFKTIFDDADIANTAENYPLFYDNQETAGGGTSTAFNPNEASTTLAVSNATAGTRVRQTKQRFNYQPGKSQYIFLTGVLGTGAAGITKRLGLFDTNNGLFFELNGTTLRVVRRTYVSGSPADNPTDQASWNLDTMDGNGPSGIDIDLTKTQIFVIDFEWLGVGRVRFGFVIDGVVYYCHEMLHSNTLSTVYMTTPNLPVRAEIVNSGAGPVSTITQICASVISEGGFEPNGIIRSHDSGILEVVAGTTATALVGIRLRSTHLGVTIIPQSLSAVVTSANDVLRWLLVLNPTVANAFTFANLANSACQVATGVAANTLSGGTVINSGYASINSREINIPVETALRLGATISGTADVLVLAAQTLTGTLNALGSLVWREVI